MITRRRQKIKLNWKLVIKIPYQQLECGLELVVPEHSDGCQDDDSESDLLSSISGDTLILGPPEQGKCPLENGN